MMAVMEGRARSRTSFRRVEGTGSSMASLVPSNFGTDGEDS